MAPNPLLHLPNKEEQILKKGKKEKNQGNPPLPPPRGPVLSETNSVSRENVKSFYYFFLKKKIKKYLAFFTIVPRKGVAQLAQRGREIHKIK